MYSKYLTQYSNSIVCGYAAGLGAFRIGRVSNLDCCLIHIVTASIITYKCLKA